MIMSDMDDLRKIVNIRFEQLSMNEANLAEKLHLTTHEVFEMLSSDDIPLDMLLKICYHLQMKLSIVPNDKE